MHDDITFSINTTKNGDYLFIPRDNLHVTSFDFSLSSQDNIFYL